MMNKKIFILLGVIIVAAVAVLVIKNYKTDIPVPVPTESPSPSASLSPGVSLSPSSRPIGSPVSNIVPKCQLGGEIVYDGQVFKHTGEQEFNYWEVYDSHDIIRWELSPAGETFTVGPNMFAGLNPIKGSDFLTISFNGVVPKYKKYQLSASIDYVAVVNNAAKILNNKCTGKTTLVIGN